MRPRKLIVEGLTCFRDKHELDLSELDLFAIAGPTGAGKSTLLDAISLALYGAVPRIDKKRREELISSSCDRASVVLDFDLGAERYRVMRVVRKNGTTARLEQYDGKDFTINLADQVRAVEDKIEQLLGMNVIAFQQAVLLPQGEFARFLKAEPRKRRDMLRSLLRLEIYELMRDRANKAASEKRALVESCRKLLEKEYGGVDEGAIASLEAHRSEMAATLDAQRSRRDELQRELRSLQELCDKTSSLESCEQRMANLRVRAPELAALRGRWEVAHKAQPLRGLLDEVSAARELEAVAAKRRESAEEQATLAQSEHDAAERAAQGARVAARCIPSLRDKVAALHRLAGRLPELHSLQTAIQRRETQLAQDDADARKLELAVAKDSETVTSQTAALELARAQMHALGFAPQLLELLEQHRDRAMALAIERKGLAGIEREHASAALALEELTRRCADKTETCQTATRHAEEARLALEAAQLALQDALHRDAANTLRGALQPGDLCPVCEQAVHTLPVRSVDSTVAAARVACDQAAAHDKAAASAAQSARKDLDRDQERQTNDRVAWLALTERWEGARVKLQEDETSLCDPFAGYLTEEEPVPVIEQWLSATLADQKERRRLHQLAERSAVEAERHLAETRQTLERARDRLAERATTRQRFIDELDAEKSRLAQLRSEISAVTPSSDPAKEADELQRQIETLETAEKRTSAGINQTSLALAGATEALRAAADSAGEAESARVKREQHRDLQLHQSGFLDEAAMRAALLPPSELSRIDHELDHYDRECHAATERIQALRSELGERRVSRTALEEASSVVDRLTREVEEKSGEVKTTVQQLTQLRRRLLTATEMRQTLAADEEVLRVQGHLATDLKSDKFQAFLLQGVFTELVRGASTRLMTLSAERYSLLFRDEEIYVVDNDNAGDTRLSDTLSGGETFLTSLALALELSDQIQRAAGAVRLDSLFIDEGFGTLDPDTLRLVSGTIQDLRVGGRMVGIITHIPELRDEFEQQIIVTKHTGYSTAEVRSRL